MQVSSVTEDMGPITNHTWLVSRVNRGQELWFLQSIVLEIRPYIRQDFVDQMDAYKHPEPFPYLQQSYCFVPGELSIPSFARV